MGATAVLGAVRRAGADLAAAEIVGRSGMDLLDLAEPLPGRWPAYVLVEVVGTADVLAEALAEVDGVGDAVLAGIRRTGPGCGATGRRSPAVTAAGVPIKLDVSVPAGRLTEVWDALPELVGVGLGPCSTDTSPRRTCTSTCSTSPTRRRRRCPIGVLRYVAAAGGSISAEHGIGRAKTPWLHLTRSDAELGRDAGDQNALDPTGILNPGVLLT